MARPSSTKLRISEGDKVAGGKFAEVVLVGEAKDEYRALMKRTDGLSVKQATQLQRYFKHYADNGDDSLSDEMFKSLGRHKDGDGNEHLLFEFKPFKYRIYGVVRSCFGKRHFVGTAANPKKDQQKAKPADLLRAAKGATAIEDS